MRLTAQICSQSKVIFMNGWMMKSLLPEHRDILRMQVVKFCVAAKPRHCSSHFRAELLVRDLSGLRRFGCTDFHTKIKQHVNSCTESGHTSLSVGVRGKPRSPFAHQAVGKTASKYNRLSSQKPVKNRDCVILYENLVGIINNNFNSPLF